MSTVIYYFGYNKFQHLTYPVKWMEDGGHVVGAKPRILEGNQWVISENDYRNTSLATLSERHRINLIPEAGC